VTRILVTGASGLLGLNLSLAASHRYQVVGVVHAQPLQDPGFETIEADLLESDALPRLLDEAKPDWIINCAALADLDVCERQPELAQRINAEMPGRLAIEAAKRGLRILHVSSDTVFDGIKGNYREEDAPAPISVYGRTKRMSELAVKAAHPQALIVRPNMFGWSASGTRSLAEFFFKSLLSGIPVRGFTDRLFCPLLVTDLAAIMLELLEKSVIGMFHTVSADHLSKYQFGVALAKRFGFDADLVKPATSVSGDGVAPRSLNLTLKTANLVKVLGRRPPTIAAGIDGLYEQFRSGYRDKLLGMVPVSEMEKG